MARLVGESWHRVAAIAERYVTLARADYSAVRELAIDETSKAWGHDYVTIAADAERRAVSFVTETREAQAVERLAEDLAAHGGDPEAIRAGQHRHVAGLPQGGRDASAEDLPICR